MLKITGGSFGVSGKARIENKGLYISGASKVEYPADQIAAASARVETERKVGVVGMLIGILLFGGLGLYLGGIVGLIVGILLSIFGSFYKTSRHFIDLSFKDGKTVTLQADKTSVERILNIANS